MRIDNTTHHLCVSAIILSVIVDKNMLMTDITLRVLYKGKNTPVIEEDLRWHFPETVEFVYCILE